MRMTRILIAEDEENLRRTLVMNLELEGYKVTAVSSGNAAISAFSPGLFDLVILDVMMPGKDGFSVCVEIRSMDARIPVLFLTARNHSEDRITGLKIGGDDYLSKPFNLEELLLRVEKLIRRTSEHTNTESAEKFRIGQHTINFRTFEAKDAAGNAIQLSHKEVQLLQLLTSRKNEVISREEILDRIWGTEAFPSSRTIDNYIVNFRKYFERENGTHRYFQSVRGVGYRFTEEDTPDA